MREKPPLQDPANPAPTRPLRRSQTPIRARVCQIGNSVGVRLPAALALKPGDEVQITVQPLDEWPEEFLNLAPVEDDFQVPERGSGKAFIERLKVLFEDKGGL